MSAPDYLSPPPGPADEKAARALLSFRILATAVSILGTALLVMIWLAQIRLRSLAFGFAGNVMAVNQQFEWFGFILLAFLSAAQYLVVWRADLSSRWWRPLAFEMSMGAGFALTALVVIGPDVTCSGNQCASYYPAGLITIPITLSLMAAAGLGLLWSWVTRSTRRGEFATGS